MANAEDKHSPGLKPLTKKQKNGSLLFRPADLVDELRRILSQSNFEWAAEKRALSSAALVYLLRNKRPNRDERWYIELWDELARRAGGQAYNQASGLAPQHAQDVREEVCDWLRQVVFSNDERADPLEAFFGRVIMAKSIDTIRKIKLRNSVERNESEFETEDGIPRDRLDAMNLRNVGQAMPRAEAAARVAAVMSKLTEREREAVTAVHVEGYAQKSNDAEEVTAAKLLNVSPRRVSELLSNARKRTSGDEGQP